MIERNDIALAATGLPLTIVPRLHKLAMELLEERDAALKRAEALEEILIERSMATHQSSGGLLSMNQRIELLRNNAKREIQRILKAKKKEIHEENKRMGCNHPGPICEA